MTEAVEDDSPVRALELREYKGKWTLYDTSGWIIIITRDKSLAEAIAARRGAKKTHK